MEWAGNVCKAGPGAFVLAVRSEFLELRLLVLLQKPRESARAPGGRGFECIGSFYAPSGRWKSTGSH